MRNFHVRFMGFIPMTWDNDGEESGPTNRWYMSGECLERDCPERLRLYNHSTMPARLEHYVELAPGLTPDQVRATLVRNIDEFLKLMLEHNEEQHKETNDGP